MSYCLTDTSDISSPHQAVKVVQYVFEKTYLFMVVMVFNESYVSHQKITNHQLIFYASLWPYLSLVVESSTVSSPPSLSLEVYSLQFTVTDSFSEQLPAIRFQSPDKPVILHLVVSWEVIKKIFKIKLTTWDILILFAHVKCQKLLYW